MYFEILIYCGVSGPAHCDTGHAYKSIHRSSHTFLSMLPLSNSSTCEFFLAGSASHSVGTLTQRIIIMNCSQHQNISDNSSRSSHKMTDFVLNFYLNMTSKLFIGCF